MANRQVRIKMIIDKNIRDILLKESKNSNIGFITVSNVDVSSDYSYVKVYVSFYFNHEENFNKLLKIKGLVRSLLAKKIKLRRAPEIEFILDRGFATEDKITDLLKKEEEELKNMKNN